MRAIAQGAFPRAVGQKRDKRGPVGDDWDDTVQSRQSAQAISDNHLPGRPGEPVSVSFVQQTSDEIGYWLFDGAAPRDAVKILSECRLALPGGEVTLAIIGSSHFLEISSGDTLLTEMLTSARPGLDHLPMARPLRTGHEGVRLIRGGLDYRFRVEHLRYRTESFDKESRRLTQDAAYRLSYSFPAGPHETGAVTCLDWRVDGPRFALETYHTFPGESAIVRSRTEVGFPEKGGSP